MDNGLLLAIVQEATQAAPPAAGAAAGWFSMQFSMGDLSSVGSVIAAYALIRERLARLETKVEPMWDAWNMRDHDRRRE